MAYTVLQQFFSIRVERVVMNHADEEGKTYPASLYCVTLLHFFNLYICVNHYVPVDVYCQYIQLHLHFCINVLDVSSHILQIFSKVTKKYLN